MIQSKAKTNHSITLPYKTKVKSKYKQANVVLHFQTVKVDNVKTQGAYGGGAEWISLGSSVSESFSRQRDYKSYKAHVNRRKDIRAFLNQREACCQTPGGKDVMQN